MASGAVLSYRNDLQEKLNAKRSELVETEETLKKYVGPIVATQDMSSRPSFRGRLGPPPQRDGVENRRLSVPDGQPQRRRLSAMGGGRLSLEGRLGPKVEGRLGPKVDEVEPDEIVEDERKVMSRVVYEQKTREEALAEKKVDRAETQRNKRIFGNLLGTLQKFRQDETKIKDREQKKRKIEAKIDEKTEKEREDAKRKKQELFTERQRKQHELRVLQVQMKRVEEFEFWEKAKRNESHFIRTKTSTPAIYFLPKEHNEATMTALEESMEVIEKEIEEAKIKFEEELLKIAAKAEHPEKDPEELDDEDEGEEENVKNLSSVVSTVQRPPPIKSEASERRRSDSTKSVEKDEGRHRNDSIKSVDKKEDRRRNDSTKSNEAENKHEETSNGHEEVTVKVESEKPKSIQPEEKETASEDLLVEKKKKSIPEKEEVKDAKVIDEKPKVKKEKDEKSTLKKPSVKKDSTKRRRKSSSSSTSGTSSEDESSTSGSSSSSSDSTDDEKPAKKKSKPVQKRQKQKSK